MKYKKRKIFIMGALLLLGVMTIFSVALAAKYTGENGALSRGGVLDMLGLDVYRQGAVATGNPPLTAKSAICIDAQTGKVIHTRNADDKCYPAGTTKIMTMILALENSNMDDMLEIGPAAVNAEGSSLGLQLGEKISMRDLLYAIAMVPANDATVAIAEHIAGDVPKFVDMMNDKARELGCDHTHFVNPNGLPNDDHYVTAHDLARITAYGYNNLPMFVKIISTPEYLFPTKGIDRHLVNDNRLLWGYPGCNGVKAGFTEKAGRCFVGAAVKNEVQLITVVLNADDMFNDSIRLWDYCFKKITPHFFAEEGKELTKLRVMNNRKRYVSAHVDKDIIAAVTNDLDKYELRIEPNTNKLRTSVYTGEILGKVTLCYEGKGVVNADLISSETIQSKSFFRLIYKQIKNLLT